MFIRAADAVSPANFPTEGIVSHDPEAPPSVYWVVKYKWVAQLVLSLFPCRQK